MFLSMALILVAAYTPELFGSSFRWYMTDTVLLVAMIPITYSIGEVTSRWVAGGSGSTKKARQRSSPLAKLSSIVNSIVIACIIVLYPVVLMPFYRSSDATDLQRVLAVCVLHPIVHETTMSIQRSTNERSHVLKVTTSDPRRYHFALASLGGGKLS